MNKFNVAIARNFSPRDRYTFDRVLTFCVKSARTRFVRFSFPGTKPRCGVCGPFQILAVHSWYAWYPGVRLKYWNKMLVRRSSNSRPIPPVYLFWPCPFAAFFLLHARHFSLLVVSTIVSTPFLPPDHSYYLHRVPLDHRLCKSLFSIFLSSFFTNILRKIYHFLLFPSVLHGRGYV